MENNNQKIKGNNNIQVGGDFNGNIIKTEKVYNRPKVIHNPDEHITAEQQFEIKSHIDELVRMVSSVDTNTDSRPKLYKREWGFFKKQFKVSAYQVLPKKDYEDAIKYLKKRIAYLGKPKQRRGDNDAWRKNQYKAINARATQLGMSRDERLAFATEVLELKTPLNSLKELSDTRLNKLYKKIMAKRKK
ncbi:ORF6C domain-containing protein [Riemerella anatipestifer]|uniref:ORF6C domain-containing protein n=1 Tax=Riemerella anatipestifer TaxID=34085 RepID=UPI00129E2303|nr:ORF6C domain-containing protein [Riemerella anatipestifer]MRM84913.1 hypothetical protein [Riemerella anatipestifer]